MKKLLSILFLLIVSISFAQTKFDAQALLQPRTGTPKLVYDFTGILSADQQAALEHKLVAFDDSSSTQIAVVIIPSLDGYDVADYNVQLGRAWGVGGKEFNNGVVLLISKDDRKLNIATGYGVEGALPDITAKHIIEDVIVPNFKGEDYYRGIDEGTDAIIKAVKGEYAAPAGYHKKKGLGAGRIVFIIIIVIVFLIITSGGSGGGGFMSRRGYRGFDGPVIFPGGWSGGGGGSSSGGGFGGFGGGSFGGGGASGSW